MIVQPDWLKTSSELESNTFFNRNFDNYLLFHTWKLSYTHMFMHLNPTYIFIYNLLQAEYEDLQNGVETVQDLIERQGTPVFASLEVALACTSKVLKENLAIEELGLADQAQPVRLAHVQERNCNTHAFPMFQFQTNVE